MAKQGPHENDGSDNTKSKSHNDPDKSVTITTGSYKKQETYEQQAREHQATNKQAPAARNDGNEDTRDKPSIEGAPRDRNADDREDSRRSGSESNASR